MQKYISLKQVAEEQNLKPVTLRKYIKEGKLKAFKSGNRYYVSPEDYQVFEVSRLIGNIARNPKELADLTTAIMNANKSDLSNNLEKQREEIARLFGGNNDKQKN